MTNPLNRLFRDKFTFLVHKVEEGGSHRFDLDVVFAQQLFETENVFVDRLIVPLLSFQQYSVLTSRIVVSEYIRKTACGTDGERNVHESFVLDAVRVIRIRDR